MLAIPLVATPSQQLTVQLAGQPCTIVVKQRSTGLYVDLYVNSGLIIGGVIAQNANRIVRNAYLGFIGDLAFFDSEGSSDPDFAGLGPEGRFTLMYLELADLGQ